MGILREMGASSSRSPVVDSTFLARAAKDAAGDRRAVLVTADSETYPAAELEESRRSPPSSGFAHRIVQTP